jgi:hypothetical protein
MDGDDGAQSGSHVAAEHHLLVSIEIRHLKEVHEPHHTPAPLHGARQRLPVDALR